MKGEKANEIKEKLLNFDRKLSGEVKVYSESPKVANILESTDRNLHSRSRNCSVNNEMTRTNGQSYSINTNDANYNESPEFYEINSKLESYSQNVTRKLKENKENVAYGILILEETVNDLKKEKYELNRENEELKEKNKNLFQSLSEVRAKVIELQDEKSSLITALKLIQRESVLSPERKKIEDLESENKNLRVATRTLQEDLDKSNREKQEFAKVKKRSGSISITPDATISYESKNQFEVLSVSDQEFEEDVNKSASEHKEKVTHEIGSDIVIIGDSIIKNIQPRKLTRNKKVHKYTFPGKTADEIEKEINFDNLKTIPSHIIIHVGTNNLPLETATECVQKIEKLATKVKAQFPYSKIGLSGITVRHDIVMSEKITKVNEEIGQICTKLNASFIDNSTIDHSCLNGSKLHLNAKGSAILAVHLIKFLKGGKASTSTLPKKQRYEDFQRSAIQKLGELLKMIIPPDESTRHRKKH